MARLLGITKTAYENLEDPLHKLTVREMQMCCDAMGIPVHEFFEVEKQVPRRANILRAYKSALTLKEQSETLKDSVLLDRLIEDLLKAMPGLDKSSAVTGKTVGPWPAVGHRRTQDELGRAAEMPIDMGTILQTETYEHSI